MTYSLLALFAVVFIAYTAAQSNEDPCSKLASCQDCVAQAYCGWCSTFVIYNDGTKGKQCAGFDPDHPHTKPFTCNGRYQTTECTPGWVCDYVSLKCFETAPGQGDDKAICEEECIKPPQTYVCDNTNYTCVETTPGHGTSYPVCEQGCHEGYACNAANLTCFKSAGGSSLESCLDGCGKKSNNTPSDLIGVWRGLEINDEYLAGEWQVKFGADNVTIRFPLSAKTILEGIVQTITRPVHQLYITITDGPDAYKNKVLRSLYQYVYGPEVRLATLAVSAPDGPLPESFDDAMTDPDMSVLVMMQCLNDQVCDFKFGDVLDMFGEEPERRALLPEAFQPKNLKLNDSCSPFNDCPDCVAQKFCGWCTTNVVYNDSTIGTHCAGFNPDNTKKPFVCKGSYSTNTCPLPPTNPTGASPIAPIAPVPKTPSSPVAPPPIIPPAQPEPAYKCNHTIFKCYEVKPGQGSSKAVCEQNCAPPRNVTPIALLGKWRGLQINKPYSPGEWKADFKNDSVTVTSPMGQVIKGTVAGDSSQLWIYMANGDVIRGIWQLAYGVQTKDFAWAWGPLNGAAPKSFVEAMDSRGMTEYEFVACLKPNCNFNHLDSVVE